MNINDILRKQIAYNRYGASMGRRTEPMQREERAHLQRVSLDSGGYDAGGAYWGSGRDVPYLYCAFYDESDERVFVRAWSRDKAKFEISAQGHRVQFHR